MTIQLFCVPHAGGTASVFRRWIGDFAPDVEVLPLELAGRGSRSALPFSDTVPQAATDLLRQLRSRRDDRDDRPYVLLGHCMGAVLAFELARQTSALGRQPPLLLVVSGRNPPHLQTEWGLRVAELPDDQLFAELKAVGGIPPGLSRAMAGAFLPVLRADQRMIHRYRVTSPLPRLEMPVLVLAGSDDFMTSRAELPGWSDYTTAGVVTETLDGAHYFIYEHALAVRDLILAQLPATRARRGGGAPG
jgi:surfactin synthase thioesterase subunit